MLEDEIKQSRPFASQEEKVFLALQRTASLLIQALSSRLKPHGLTPTQYNVLRILRGSHPHAMTCGDIGSRLVSPVPDVTRLVDRLVRRELATRNRDRADRRVVQVGISEAGLELLSGLDKPVEAWLESFLGHLDGSSLDTLNDLLDRARQGI